MSVLSKITTFFTTTLLWMYAFLLRPFERRAARHASVVTPYPLMPEWETRILDISYDTSGSGVEKGMDLEQGVFADRKDLFSQVVHTKTATSKQGRPDARGGSRPLSRLSFSAKDMKGQRAAAAPLSIVTNCVRASAPLHKRVASKTDRENTPLAPRKPTPLRRMPRYLNLTGTSPTKPAPSTAHSPSGSSKSRRSTLACPAERAARPRKSVSFATAESSPCISPVKLESRRGPGASIDFAARVRSVFYKRADVYDDEDCDSVRHLFDRDSLYSQPAARDCDEEDDDDYGTPLTLRSTCYSPSRPSARDVFSAPGSSRLPYLRDSGASWASVARFSSSSSTTVFNDLLASVERKYPASEWTDIVLVGEGEKQADRAGRGRKAHGGMDGVEAPWSEVFCLEDYGI
ncbi:hypothetical protein FB451DRAFT_246453 [Mycena latifolia]|nr:hypothetical protein FB451DRAFT_246453 [Mycena latifolia]